MDKKAPPLSAPPLAAAVKKPIATAGFECLDATFRPPRMILMAVEGWGKTTIGAHIKDAVMILANTETGYETLLGVGTVPKVPVKQVCTWDETLKAIDQVGDRPLVLDELSGFESMCHQHVCSRTYDNNWVNFKAFHKGYDVAVDEWMKFLQKLQQLPNMVLALCHVTDRQFKDPLVDSYNKYVGSLHKYTWAPCKRWADTVLFGNFHVKTSEGKGTGGTLRRLHTQNHAAYDAKNRYNMPATIEMGSAPELMWDKISEFVFKEKK